MRVSAQRKYLAAIRSFVSSQAGALGAETDNINSLVQAVDEAASNIIMHGYRESPGIIEVEVKHLPGQVQIILRDSAPPFNPTQVPSPDIDLPLEQRPIGGLGIHLIRHCVDEFSHTIDEHGRNELTLIKYLPERAN